MPRLFDISKDEIIQDLKLVKKDLNLVSLEYVPSCERIETSSLSKEEKITNLSLNFELIRIDVENKFICIYPICLRSDNINFLKNKYSSIESITLRGDKILNLLIGYDDEKCCIPESVYDILEIIDGLPRGFIKDYEYGFGFFKECNLIINQIEKILDIKHLIISDNEETHINENSYILKYDQFIAIRDGLERISRQYQNYGRIQKDIFAHNEILSILDHEAYPEMPQPYVKDTIYRLISSRSSLSSLSKRDSKAVLDLISNNAKNYYKEDRERSVKLQQDIELFNLERLINEMGELLEKTSSNEEKWQKLLSDNPFVLSLAFGYPIIKIQEQASVGGRKINGSGDKITDFLVKNYLTDNVALVEIKKPSTELLQIRPYRGGVFAASIDLSGSINQMLDQKYKFQKEINNHKVESKIYDMESYSIDCVLIIGLIPKEEDRKKCFELFRHNSKDIKIITFDELLGRLKEIYLFLEPVHKPYEPDEPYFENLGF